MASRFEEITEDDLAELLEKRDSLSTKNVIKGAMNILKNYCDDKNVALDVGLENAELNGLLSKFYMAVRTKDGHLYSKKSFLSIRYGLQKHFEKARGVDVVNSTDFSGANKIFNAILVKLKKEGKAKVTHKQPLSPEDLEKLYDSFDLDTPKGLQNKTFFYLIIFFCNRGRENLREIKKSDFIFEENGRFIEIRDLATKNHRCDKQEEDSQGGRIYQTGNKMCPYRSFIKYLSVLNPECVSFFQRPKQKVKSSDVWFDNVPVGKHTLGDKMKHLSTEAGLSKVYTNHCLRATSITLLDGYEARHVMAISGHKSEASIRSYARTSEQQKEKMALTIAEAVSGANESIVLPGPAETIPGAPHGMELSDTDLLQLTSSQELILLREIHVQAVPVPVSCDQDQSVHNSQETMIRNTVQRSSYVAPVYNFHNSIVHIHHH